MGIKASSLQKKTTKMVHGAGGYIVNIISSSTRGVLDMVACIHGLFWAFEIKTKTDRLSALQRNEIDEIQDAGGKYVIITEETNFNDLGKTILEYSVQNKY